MTCRKIYNTPQNYAWGSMTLIPDFMKTLRTGQPQAEVWFGTHQASTASYYDDDELISNDVELPFMLKVLAAEKPLSLQVHPSKEQAEVGFVKENLANVARNAYTRNYKDDNHKPEMIISLSDEFYALCGFQPIESSITVIEELMSHVEYSDFHNALDEVKSLLKRNEDLKVIVERLLTEEIGVLCAAAITDAMAHYHIDTTSTPAMKILHEVTSAFPQDEGLSVVLLMNSIILKRGEALFLPAGNIHAYIKGLGVEVMANSDNVLRGGLTNKYIDIDELIKVLDTSIMKDVLLQPEEKNGIKTYTPIQDFTVIDAQGKVEINLHNQNTICLAISGGDITIENESMSVEQGEAFLIQQEEMIQINGHFIFAFHNEG